MTQGTLRNMHIVHQSMLHSNTLFIVFLASRGGGDLKKTTEMNGLVVHNSICM